MADPDQTVASQTGRIINLESSIRELGSALLPDYLSSMSVDKAMARLLERSKQRASHFHPETIAKDQFPTHTRDGIAHYADGSTVDTRADARAARELYGKHPDEAPDHPFAGSGADGGETIGKTWAGLARDLIQQDVTASTTRAFLMCLRELHGRPQVLHIPAQRVELAYRLEKARLIEIDIDEEGAPFARLTTFGWTVVGTLDEIEGILVTQDGVIEIAIKQPPQIKGDGACWADRPIDDLLNKMKAAQAMDEHGWIPGPFVAAVRRLGARGVFGANGELDPSVDELAPVYEVDRPLRVAVIVILAALARRPSSQLHFSGNAYWNPMAETVVTFPGAHPGPRAASVALASDKEIEALRAVQRKRETPEARVQGVDRWINMINAEALAQEEASRTLEERVSRLEQMAGAFGTLVRETTVDVGLDDLCERDVEGVLLYCATHIKRMQEGQKLLHTVQAGSPADELLNRLLRESQTVGSANALAGLIKTMAEMASMHGAIELWFFASQAPA